MAVKTIKRGLSKKAKKLDSDKQIIKEEYVKKSSAPISNSEAKIYGKALEELRRKDGKIYTEDIVMHAQNEGHVLHSYTGFDWNTESAAYKYNKAKAGELLNSIAIEITYRERETQEITVQVIPAFSNTKRFNESIKDRELSGESGSKRMLDILQNEQERNKLLVDYGLKLRSLQQKYDYLFEYYPELKRDFKKVRDVAEHIIDEYYQTDDDL